MTSIEVLVALGRPASSNRSLDDGGGDFVLNGEDIGQLAIEALRPELVAAFGIDELRRDAHAIAGRANAAFEAVPTRNLLPISVTSRSWPRNAGRRPGNHAQTGDAREGVDDFLGDAVTEILVIPQRAQIGKRQDDDRGEPGALIREFRRDGAFGGRRIDALQGFQQFVRHAVAALRVLLEGLVDDGRERRGQRTDSMSGRGGLPIQELIEDRGRGAAGERRSPGRHLEQHHSQRENVTARVERLAERLFG